MTEMHDPADEVSIRRGICHMTWSIIARERESGKFGIAVATRFFAVGALVPYIAPGAGAVATQALVNPFFGVNGLKLLRAGHGASVTVSTLVAADAGRDHRQLHVMDRHGGCAAHTGKSCVHWCGHKSGEDFSVAGNMLAGPQVVDRTASAYAAAHALPFARRLIAALRAGEAAGGDKRGKQSAALLIHGDEDWPDLDLRVDDHPDPLAELERLEEVSREFFVHFARFLPSTRDPVGITDRAIIEHEVASAVAAQDSQ
jgi:uncharacterized Ntn-hydrolase superfamily protein